MIASAHEEPVRTGLAPAFAAARARLALVALLFVLAAVGWWWMVGEMQGMDGGPWTGLGALAWFVGVWVVMMAAMMFPSVAPTVALYSKLTQSRAFGAPLVFTAGYLLTWTAVGVSAFVVAAVGGRVLGDVLAWDQRRSLDRGVDASGRCAVRGDTAQGRLPRQVPEPARLPARLVARRGCRVRCGWARGMARGASGAAGR